MRIILPAAVAFLITASAQTIMPPRTITATGNATVSAQPDKAIIDIGVTTQATTASDASSQNATQVSQVLAAIRLVLGQAADIQTVNYSLNPVYSQGSTQTIIGYVA